MTAYILVRVNVTDMQQYQEYMKLTPATIEQYGGKFIVRGGEKITLEGPEETRRIVLLEFPSVDQARRWYESPEYQHAISVRANAADLQFVIIEGVS